MIEYLIQGKIDLVINIPKNYQEQELTNDYLIHRKAVDFFVPPITNIQLAQRFVEALLRKHLSDLNIKSWEEYESNNIKHPNTFTLQSTKLLSNVAIIGSKARVPV